MTAYEDLRNVLGSYQRSGEIYKQIAHFPAAREEAAQFALEELGEKGEAEAQILRNPETPIEKVAEGLKFSLVRRQQKLEELVENKFDDILNDKNIKKEKLGELLLRYEPKEKVSGNYKELAEYHSIYRNVFLYQNKDNRELFAAFGIDPREVNKILNEMGRDVVEYYENQYKEEKGDSNEVKTQKELLKRFFLSLYVGEDGKPVKNGEYLMVKYEAINKDKLENFEEKLKTREALTDYIKATLPEDKNRRLNFLGSLVG